MGHQNQLDTSALSKAQALLSALLLAIITPLCATPALLFSIDLIRHGERTPTYIIPGEPLYWPQGPGQLTAKGAEQERLLGAKLREYYVTKMHLLPSHYQPSTLYVRSTNYTRTIQSAEAFLSGLYPPSTRDSPTQAILIKTVPKQRDHLLVNRALKNPWSRLTCYLRTRSFWKQKTSPIQAKLARWSTIAKLPLTGFYPLNHFADNLAIRKAKGIAPPKGMTQADADNIIALSREAVVNNYHQHALTDPMGRVFLKTINDYITSAQEHRTPLKYVLLSGHDSSIMTVLNTLGVPFDRIPGYASRLNFSLYTTEGRDQIVVTLNGQPMAIPGCGPDSCSAAQWAHLVNTR